MEREGMWCIFPESDNGFLIFYLLKKLRYYDIISYTYVIFAKDSHGKSFYSFVYYAWKEAVFEKFLQGKSLSDEEKIIGGVLIDGYSIKLRSNHPKLAY